MESNTRKMKPETRKSKKAAVCAGSMAATLCAPSKIYINFSLYHGFAWMDSKIKLSTTCFGRKTGTGITIVLRIHRIDPFYKIFQYSKNI